MRRVGHNRVDDRLVGWQDVMPTLLHLAGVDIPETVDGMPMVGDKKREWLYGEVGSGGSATRMIHEGRYKLIYYAMGNYSQLFDLEEDPRELNDLSDSPAHAEILKRLTNLLIGELYGGDEEWVKDDVYLLDYLIRHIVHLRIVVYLDNADFTGRKLRLLDVEYR